LSKPEDIAVKGFEAFKRGKTSYIPGFRNKLIHTLLPRLLPRTMVSWIGYHALKKRT
jgi:short-subunit dehydrogenase